MIPAKHFYMIRHGETEANAAQLMAGSHDSPLNETGRAQARTAQAILGQLKIKPKVIVHSHLSRARDTATILNEVLSVPQYEDEDLGELHAGDWEGQHYDICRPMLRGWQDPPNGETFKAFCARLKRGKTNALESYEAPVMIVSHGGVFRGLGKMFGLNTPGVFRNCHLYEFIPNSESSAFPFEVWSYHLHETADGSTVVREQSFIYHEELEAESA